jgi:hypothetical protein
VKDNPGLLLRELIKELINKINSFKLTKLSNINITTEELVLLKQGLKYLN